jgi:glutamate-ammonia-ligase adenylyltransferase
LVGITEELSNLADIALGTAFDMCRSDLVRRHGDPKSAGEPGRKCECPFVILGMGKLGGRELNFSSDIDLIFVYEEHGETAGADGGSAGCLSNQEFFRKLGEMLVRGMSEASADGHLYRVDLRLRPEGRSGAIAASLRSCEVYYESWGQAWERQALIKARPVAGSLALGESFLRMVAPFVYRQSLDLTALDEIRAMKDRINLSVAQDQRARRNVKLGYGGIREIEFLVQGIQLLHGGKNSWVREPNTLRALHRLASQTVLADPDYEALVRAYTFLRRLEHRLQIIHDRQTHTLPDDAQEIQSLGRRMGYHPPEHPDAGATLQRITNATHAAVRSWRPASFGQRDPKRTRRWPPRTSSYCSLRRICPRNRSASGLRQSGSRTPSGRFATCSSCAKANPSPATRPRSDAVSVSWRRRSSRR